MLNQELMSLLISDDPSLTDNSSDEPDIEKISKLVIFLKVNFYLCTSSFILNLE